MKLLVANRGEIAVRIIRSARDLGVATVAVYAADDRHALHTRQADVAVALDGAGVDAYLDAEQIIEIACEQGCTAVHPGYGFLSENADFAHAVGEADLGFVGPSPRVLEILGDKAAARALARDLDVPVLPGSDGVVDLDAARAFLAGLDGAPMVIKAVYGGGGRGMRVVTAAEELEAAFARCESEAETAFGDGALYVERYMPNPRHIEVQVLGDGAHVIDLGERDCSLQRRHQKIVEYAPAPNLPERARKRIIAAALRMASELEYTSLGTFEFLINAADPDEFAFIEANARLQVEHTVTEALTGLDLVAAQLQIAQGSTLADIGLTEAPHARGAAVQLRVNLETITETGDVLPRGGVLSAFDPPGGPGVRVDTAGYTGYATSPRYDSLIAKVIVSLPTADWPRLNAKARRALAEFRIAGTDTNIPFLQALLADPDVAHGRLRTSLVDERVSELATKEPSVLHVDVDTGAAQGRAGAQLESSDPLAVLEFGQKSGARRRTEEAEPARPEGTVPVPTPLQGTVVSIEVRPGDEVAAGRLLAVMESMKMEHEIRAPVGGRVVRVDVAEGDALWEGHTLLLIEEAEVSDAAEAGEAVIDPDYIRPDLAEVYERHATTLDENRPDAVARRHGKGLRTARENIADLCDPGTFVEYGPLVIAAQRRRHSVEHLMKTTPADGMVTGVGAVNGELFGDPASRCVVMAYDYTVLAGTQGAQNHRKTDRMIDIAAEGRMPMVLFAEGGGGRPGDTDGLGSGQRTFARFATLSGLVPMIGITAGRCFAGNASLLGCCDVIIATRDSNIGMGGPAMIEGGGLGIFAPEDIGPAPVQVKSGVIDLLVDDEAEAVAMAKRYLAYFQGDLETYEAHDQRPMRHIVPENRLRAYSIREVIETIADVGSVLELRKGFGHGMVTSLIRIEGRTVGVIANNPHHLGGAIDSDAADKGARFMQLCDAFDIPILYLCDTPGIMVGPEIEHTGLVRHSSRMFLVGANLSVPFFTIVIRKAYGLGAIAMAGGSYKVPYFTVSWPTGEFGGMGLEGSVKLGYRKELAAIEDPDERRAKYEEMVARAYEVGKAVNNANLFSIDDAIDPADSRWWLASLLRSIRRAPHDGKKRPCVDAW